MSPRSARRVEEEVTLPSQEPRRYWRSRPDPFAGVWDNEVVPLLKRAPKLMAITLLRKLQDDMAIKPDLLLPLDDYRRDMSEMLERVKAVPRQPGIEEIRMPSERAFRERARSLREGIEIDRKIYDALIALPKGNLPERS